MRNQYRGVRYVSATATLVAGAMFFQLPSARADGPEFPAVQVSEPNVVPTPPSPGITAPLDEAKGAEPVSGDANPSAVPAESDLPVSDLSAEDLRALVAPIAAYPDQVLDNILKASEYPIAIHQAAQLLTQDTPQTPIDHVLQSELPESVKFLQSYPELIQELDKHLTATISLGEALKTQEQDVYAAIRSERAKLIAAEAVQPVDENSVADNGVPPAPAPYIEEPQLLPEAGVVNGAPYASATTVANQPYATQPYNCVLPYYYTGGYYSDAGGLLATSYLLNSFLYAGIGSYGYGYPYGGYGYNNYGSGYGYPYYGYGGYGGYGYGGYGYGYPYYGYGFGIGRGLLRYAFGYPYWGLFGYGYPYWNNRGYGYGYGRGYYGRHNYPYSAGYQYRNFYNYPNQYYSRHHDGNNFVGNWHDRRNFNTPGGDRVAWGQDGVRHIDRWRDGSFGGRGDRNVAGGNDRGRDGRQFGFGRTSSGNDQFNSRFGGDRRFSGMDSDRVSSATRGLSDRWNGLASRTDFAGNRGDGGVSNRRGTTILGNRSGGGADGSNSRRTLSNGFGSDPRFRASRDGDSPRFRMFSGDNASNSDAGRGANSGRARESFRLDRGGDRQPSLTNRGGDSNSRAMTSRTPLVQPKQPSESDLGRWQSSSRNLGQRDSGTTTNRGSIRDFSARSSDTMAGRMSDSFSRRAPSRSDSPQTLYLDRARTSTPQSSGPGSAMSQFRSRDGSDRFGSSQSFSRNGSASTQPDSSRAFSWGNSSRSLSPQTREAAPSRSASPRDFSWGNSSPSNTPRSSSQGGSPAQSNASRGFSWGNSSRSFVPQAGSASPSPAVTPRSIPRGDSSGSASPRNFSWGGGSSSRSFGNSIQAPSSSSPSFSRGGSSAPSIAPRSFSGGSSSTPRSFSRGGSSSSRSFGGFSSGSRGSSRSFGSGSSGGGRSFSGGGRSFGGGGRSFGGGGGRSSGGGGGRRGGR